MTTYPWPTELGARSVAFNPRGMVVSGPPSLTGQSQVSSTDAGYWVATVGIATIGAGAEVLAYRALRAKLEGGAHAVYVPAFDYGAKHNAQVPYPASGGSSVNAYAEQAYSDSQYHSDGHGFYRPAIVVTAGAAAAAGATSVQMTVTTAGTLSGGMYFSARGRMYVLRERTALSGSSQTWAIWPRLREAIASGDRLDFEKVTCKMRLMSESEMDLELGRLWMATPTVAFREVF